MEKSFICRVHVLVISLHHALHHIDLFEMLKKMESFLRTFKLQWPLMLGKLNIWKAG